jgi:hypothetical protein
VDECKPLAWGASHSAVDVWRDGYDPVTLEDERDADEVEVGLNATER